MALNTVIFDMDGLLIDSEPLWKEAADEVFLHYNIQLTETEYHTTTGLRTNEFVATWFSKFKIPDTEIGIAETKILEVVSYKIAEKGEIMPGVGYIFEFFQSHHFKIGLASSSPQFIIDQVIQQINIAPYLMATASAGNLKYGKPHPEVYLNCASALNSVPTECLCFEDSFNGMIAAKAARMKCVVIPMYHQQKEERWSAADLKLSSLQNFGALHLNVLNQ
ncbi:MAG: hexitol phosphatase HxpB [Sphingobacteriales bacterium]|uniref:hexitol phosphatase HxpB n=1 Tax=Hydrotalea flava TaxID=714549 RepID=UPI00082ABEE5|nr:hexitol phosphatase HxpB [Hydrotalea flava]RTL51052.1 MAG: hexitol phosphatase HxpB [Sphingobacteriales bacterium]